MNTLTRSLARTLSLVTVIGVSLPAQASAKKVDTVTIDVTEHGSRAKTSLSFVVVPGGSVSGWTTLGGERVHCRAAAEFEDGDKLRVDLRCGPHARQADQTLKIQAEVTVTGKRSVRIGEMPGADGTKTVVTARRS